MNSAACPEIWGCYGHPAAVGALAPSRGAPTVALLDRDGGSWGHVLGGAGVADEDAIRWVLPSGDATLVWRRDGELGLSRSARGAHTLYFRREGGLLWFASRLPRLMERMPADALRLDVRCLAELLALGRVLPPLTTFAGIEHLEPGVDLTWRAAGGAPELARRLQQALHDGGESPGEQPLAQAADLFGPHPTLPGTAAPQAARVEASPVEVYDQLALGGAVLGQPLAGWREAVFSTWLAGGRVPSGSTWDVGADLRSVEAPADDSLLLRTMLRGRWRHRLLEYWLDERRPQLVQGEVDARTVPARRILPERRLHLTALAQARGRTLKFGRSTGGAAASAVTNEATTGFPIDAPEVGNLYSNAINLHHGRAALGEIVLRDVLKLSPCNLRPGAIAAAPGVQARLQQALAAFLSLTYVWRFATALPLPACAGGNNDMDAR